MTLHGWGNSLSFVTLCVAGEIKVQPDSQELTAGGDDEIESDSWEAR